MPDAPFDRIAPLAQELLDLTARIGGRADEDPFGNPVLLVSLAISRRIEAGTLDDDAIAASDRVPARCRVRRSRAAGSRIMSAAPMSTATRRDPARASRSICCGPIPNDSPVRWAEYRALVERTRFAAVFTAHPTFALPLIGRRKPWRRPPAAGPRLVPVSHRPPPITLRERIRASRGARSRNGRDAIDRFNAALLSRRTRRAGRIAGPNSIRGR